MPNKALNDETSCLMQAILARKMELEKQGFLPRVVLLGSEAFALLEHDWFDAASDVLGDNTSIKNRMRNRTAGDGLLFDLVVFKVDTIEGFEVR